MRGPGGTAYEGIPTVLIITPCLISPTAQAEPSIGLSIFAQKENGTFASPSPPPTPFHLPQ